MMTFVALLILGAAQVGLMWLARAATHILAPVRDGPRRRLRAFFHWYGSGLVNALLLSVIPTLLASLLETWLAQVQRQVSAAAVGFAVLGFVYPVWVQVTVRRDAG